MRATQSRQFEDDVTRALPARRSPTPRTRLLGTRRRSTGSARHSRLPAIKSVPEAHARVGSTPGGRWAASSIRFNFIDGRASRDVGREDQPTHFSSCWRWTRRRWRPEKLRATAWEKVLRSARGGLQQQCRRSWARPDRDSGLHGGAKHPRFRRSIKSLLAGDASSRGRNCGYDARLTRRDAERRPAPRRGRARSALRSGKGRPDPSGSTSNSLSPVSIARRPPPA
jgi:hypothetical protein